jgi:FkbM family methyltransferase
MTEHKASVRFVWGRKDMYLPVNNNALKCIVVQCCLKGRVWERELSKRIHDDCAAHEGECAIDVGANIGVHSMGMMDAIGAGVVLAIEPQKELVSTLVKSLALKQDARFEVHEKLLSSSSREHNFACNGTGRSRIVGSGGKEIDSVTKGWPVETLTCTTLDDIVFGNPTHITSAAILTDDQGNSGSAPPCSVSATSATRPLPRVCVVKIDVEGHEFDVLNGAIKLIEKDRPCKPHINSAYLLCSFCVR